MTPPKDLSQLKPCTGANLMRPKKLVNSAMVLTASTSTTCNAELTAMTAASPGLRTTPRSGTPIRLFADARLSKSVRLSSATDALSLTQASVALIAVNATCHGRLLTLWEPREVPQPADASTPGEHMPNYLQLKHHYIEES